MCGIGSGSQPTFVLARQCQKEAAAATWVLTRPSRAAYTAQQLGINRDSVLLAYKKEDRLGRGGGKKLTGQLP